MSILFKSKNGNILYAIAWENWADRRTGFDYLHAKDRDDAVNQVLQNKRFGAVRIVSIAPAIGAKVKVSSNPNIKPQLVV